MKISLFTKIAVYENTFIGYFPAPAKKGCSGQKGLLRLRLRNTADVLFFICHGCIYFNYHYNFLCLGSVRWRTVLISLLRTKL